MALKGNLRDFTITQLLNLINLARKTGTLVVEGSKETAWISFREGKLAYAQMGNEDVNLGYILYKANRFSAAQYKTLRTRTVNMGDKELGLLLINAGYVTREDVLNALQNHFVNVVQRLFTWVEGFFRFENNALPPQDKIITKIDLENIIIEGSRQMREWEQLQDEIPNLDMALKFVDRPGANLKNINLSVQEWKVVSYIDPKNTMRQISKATNMNDLEIRRIVYGLLTAGLVQIIRPYTDKPKPPALQKAIPAKTKEEQKSLVNRIISRIRSI